MTQAKVNRKRNKLINFWVTAHEMDLIETRVKLTGMAKGEFLIKTLSEQNISLSVGKYESDRLSLELNRLSNALTSCNTESDEGLALLNECKLLFTELVNIIKNEDSFNG